MSKKMYVSFLVLSFVSVYFCQEQIHAKEYFENKSFELFEHLTEQVSLPFKKSNFQDTNFAKSSFQDLDVTSNFLDQFTNKHEIDKKEIRNQKENKFFVPLHESTKNRADSKEERRYKEFRQFDLGMPGADWLPSPMDPITNGGFAVSDDNGAPVPYHLNGHVDLQREPAWKAAD